MQKPGWSVDFTKRDCVNRVFDVEEAECLIEEMKKKLKENLTGAKGSLPSLTWGVEVENNARSGGYEAILSGPQQRSEAVTLPNSLRIERG